MKNLLKLIVIAGLASCATTDQDLNKTVNPFIGTGGHGHTYLVQQCHLEWFN